MYNLSALSREYKGLKEPWDIPFEKKMNMVVSARLSGKKTVVYLYENPDSSTFRYRGYNMCSALKNSAAWGSAWFFSYELGKLMNYMEFIDVAVIIRYRWNEALEGFMEECKKRRIKTVFDVDDLVYDTKYLHVLINTFGVDFSSHSMYDLWFAYFSRLSMTGSGCDACLTTNRLIMEKMSGYFGKPGYVIPNFLNTEQVQTSARLLAEKTRKGFEKPFVIGYFSGSPSHKNDFELVSAELEKLMEENSGISLKVAGFMEMPRNLGKYLKNGRVKRVPFKDFRELQKEIAEVDVNIVPLLDNVFTNCKSELKFFESAIVGTVTCASPTYVYGRVIKHGENGYLCRQGEWHDVIEGLYKNGIRPEVVENARALSLKLYEPGNQLETMEKTLGDICAL